MADIFNFTDTWNDGTATFSADKCNVTDTASATASNLLQRQVGGVDKFQVRKDGSTIQGDTLLTDPLYDPTLHGVRVGSNSALGVYNQLESAQNGAAYCAFLWLNRARGTLQVPLAVQSGDCLGSIAFGGYDGVNPGWQQPWIIQAEVSGAVADGVMPTDLVFYGKGSAGGFVEVGRIKDDGTFVWAGQFATAAAAPTLTSGTTIVPTASISFVSGTTDVVNITAPAAFAAGGGQITLIPTGVWHTTTAGNIANAITAVVNVPIIGVYDHTTAKWYMK